MATAVPFVGGSNELRRKKADTQRTVNMYPSFIESGDGKANARMFLKSIPGLRQFSVTPAPPPPAPAPPTFLLHGNNSTYDAGAYHIPALGYNGIYDVSSKFGPGAFKFETTDDLLQYESEYLTPVASDPNLSCMTFEFFWKMGAFANRTDVIVRIDFPDSQYVQIYYFGSGIWQMMITGVERLRPIPGLTGADWQHVVMQFGVGIMNMFVDGVKVYEIALQVYDEDPLGSTETRLSFGGNSAGAEGSHVWNMWIDEVRIDIKDSFTYTENFTPPTAPFLPEGDGP